MAAIYYFVLVTFIWNYWVVETVTMNTCPSACSCLGDYIDCSRLGLIEVPKDLPTWVTDLEIQSNGISQLHPEDFKDLLRLQKIDLSNNELTFINETVFANLPALKEIKINNNKLKELPIFIGNPLLSRLELLHNLIHTINGNALAHVPLLDTLDLSYNGITDLTNGTFPANLSITKLFLRNNEIFLFETGCFYNLTKLESLKLNKNKISHLPKDLFAKSSNLKSLDLSKNQLSTLMGLTFQGLDSLKVLKLQRNNINILEDGVFFRLTSLQKLELDDNNLMTISQNWLYGLLHLEELSISHNKIFKIETKAWETAPKLTHLDLSFNEFVTLEADMLSGLTNLKSLSLANNRMETIQEDTFKTLAFLEELNLNNNLISSTIEDMKGAFTGLVSLKRLSLMNNKIKTLTKQAFTGLDHLKELLLNSNNITSIIGNVFEPLTQLTHLAFNTSSLFCDCSLSWVPVWLCDNKFEDSVTAKCSHPDSIRGRSIFDIDSSLYKCDGQFLKPEIVLNPKQQVVLKGENFTLNCTAASTESQGSPTEFHWKKDNIMLTDVKTEDTAHRSGNLTHYMSKLFIRNAEDSDSGRYHCVISNEFGSAYSKKAKVDVFVFPKFTKRPQNVTAKALTQATLVCAAEGQPKPVISWQKDGGFDHFPAAQERRMHVIPEDDHFFIVEVKAADEGIYSCIAKNDAGTIVANVTLTVLQTPSFVRKMEDKDSRIGATTVIECLAQGSPQPTLTWLHDGQPLDVGQRHFFTAENRLLIIVETEAKDAGEYTCEMSNTLGTIRGTSKLTVVTGSSNVAKGKEDKNGSGGLDDESMTTGIIIIAVVCCVVGTSLVWVIFIYQTRKKQELYSATPTDETTLPSSGYLSSDKEGSYTLGIPVASTTAYQCQEMQMKESGYESSSGRFRASRSAAIFPSDVNDLQQNYNFMEKDRHYLANSDENSLSSQEYPRSETDSVKSDENSVESLLSSQRQILTTFHPHLASHEQVNIVPSHSCSTTHNPSNNNFLIDTHFDQGEKKDNSVSSQTDDDLGQSYVPCNTGCVTSSVIVMCRHCGVEDLSRDSHLCVKHNNSVLPLKMLRHGRHKEHLNFDMSESPGISRSCNNVHDNLSSPVHDENIPLPPPPQLVPWSGVFYRPDYVQEDGAYMTNGSLPPAGPYVPIYHHHPMSSQCECHIHYPLTNSHKHPMELRTHSSKDTNNLVNVRSQNVNGLVGFVPQSYNVIGPTWQHSYTLPYMPEHHMHQRQPSPSRRSPGQLHQNPVTVQQDPQTLSNTLVLQTFNSSTNERTES